MKITGRNVNIQGRISVGKITSHRHLVLPTDLDGELRVDVLHLTPSMSRGVVHAYLLSTAGLERVLGEGERPSLPPNNSPLLMDKMLIALAFTSDDIRSLSVVRNKLRLPRRNFDWKPGPIWFNVFDDYAVVSDCPNVFAAYVAGLGTRAIECAL